MDNEEMMDKFSIREIEKGWTRAMLNEARSDERAKIIKLLEEETKNQHIDYETGRNSSYDDESGMIQACIKIIKEIK
jgi:hypothetical protein